MLLVVVSGDLILLLVGWEVMGICSYLLIAHDRRLPGAPAAAMKAFLVTRVGDVGFMLGIALLGLGAGSFRIADVLAHDYSAGTLTAATPAAAGRGGGQERPVPAAYLAAGRDGRPDAHLGADPRRDDGGGRGLRGGPALPALRRRAGDADGARPCWR